MGRRARSTPSTGLQPPELSIFLIKRLGGDAETAPPTQKRCLGEGHQRLVVVLMRRSESALKSVLGVFAFLKSRSCSISSKTDGVNASGVH